MIFLSPTNKIPVWHFKLSPCHPNTRNVTDRVSHPYKTTDNVSNPRNIIDNVSHPHEITDPVLHPHFPKQHQLVGAYNGNSSFTVR